MKYIAKSNFEMKDIAGECMLIPRGASTVDFNGVIVFNETGVLLYNALKEATDVPALAKLLVEKYGIDEQEAMSDVKEYIEKMLVELLPFYEALCSEFFDEDIEAAEWNYDDYFIEKVKQAIKEITNPLDV